MLNPALLTAIGDLELVARVTVEGAVAGMHRSPFHGYSAEFSQYRHYRPGDDVKHVDWKLFARTDRVYTKQYRETTNLVAQLAVDASASMAYRGAGGVSKLEYARLLAAALAYVLGRQGDGIGLTVYAEAIVQYVASRRGQPHVRRLLIALSKLEPAGATAAAAPLRRAVDLLGRRGLLVVISDLYDESDSVETELRRAVRIGHEVAVFQVLTPDELTFPFRGDVELEDMESRERVLAGGATAAVYRQEMADFLERWRSRCARYGIDYTRVSTDTPLDAALRGYLLRRIATTVATAERVGPASRKQK